MFLIMTLAISSVTIMGASFLFSEVSTAGANIGMVVSGGLAAGAILLGLKHQADGNKHLTKRDDFPTKDACDARHEAIGDNQELFAKSQGRLQKDMSKLKKANTLILAHLYKKPILPRGYEVHKNTTEVINAIAEELNGDD